MDVDEDARLEELETRAEAVQAALSSSASTKSSSPSIEANSRAFESDSELDPQVAEAAAVKIVRKRRKNDINEEEDDFVLHAASWRDMEDAREFLTAEHRDRLAGLISRWEHENIEEGDDVDLTTGRIVRSTGHLQALAPQAGLALFEESEDEEESDEELVEYDPLRNACERPATLLTELIESTRQRWMF